MCIRCCIFCLPLAIRSHVNLTVMLFPSMAEESLTPVVPKLAYSSFFCFPSVQPGLPLSLSLQDLVKGNLGFKIPLKFP